MCIEDGKPVVEKSAERPTKIKQAHKFSGRTPSSIFFRVLRLPNCKYLRPAHVQRIPSSQPYAISNRKRVYPKCKTLNSLSFGAHVVVGIKLVGGELRGNVFFYFGVHSRDRRSVH